MTFAIAILNFNGSILLKKFIPDIIKYCKNSNIYIIDNNSTDSSIDFISKNYPQIKIIKLCTNMGYAKGYNEGVKSIEEDVIFFLNNDAVFLDHYSYDEICRAFKKLPELLRISREIVKKSHKLIVLKGKNAQDEVNKLPKEMIYKYRLEKSITNNELGILIVEVIKKSE